MTGANPDLLDRNSSEQYIQESYGYYLSLLPELVDYATYLIIRCLNVGCGELAEVVLGGLFHHAIRMTDAAYELLSRSIVRPTQIIVRSLAESVWSLEYIMIDTSGRRSHCYYVHVLRKEIQHIRLALSGTHEHKVGKTIQIDIPDITIEYQRKRLKEIRSHLRRKAYSDFNRIFASRVRYANHNNRLPTEADWLQISDGHGILGMAEKLGYGDEYSILYRSYSDITHAGDYQEGIEILNGQANILDIRRPEEFHQVLRLTAGYMLRAIRLMTLRFRPDEEDNIGRKYQNEWQDRFMNIPTLQFENRTN